ncbi:ArsA family ATPase, partial [Patescibacteria group bacterium AH-259-L05]|nr:ArsA family ATPase [Patescibacteria group bacterium AH-259-L05]
MPKKHASFLANPDLQLILFGGKGGNGKTTSAAATALYLAKLWQTKKILVVSTDPAPSLSDAYGVKIGDRFTRIQGINNLWAREFNAEKLLKVWREKYDEIMKKLAERGTIFDREDIDRFFSLSLPGMDEVMAIREIARILKEEKYDLVIIDTAPTGHTLRLLTLPDLMADWIRVFDLMQEKHRYLERHYTGRYRKDECDEFLKSQSNDMKRVKALLTNGTSTEFVPVTIPEPLCVEETERFIETLNEQKIPVRRIVINRAIREGNCPFCLARRKDREKNLKEIEKKFAKEYQLVKVPTFPYEIQGIKDLKEFAKILFGKPYQFKPVQAVKIKAKISPVAPGKLPDFLKKGRELILFGGKGGVGKTSLSVAASLWIARRNPKKKILCFSTDPAHSLSDSFGQSIGDEVTQISIPAPKGRGLASSGKNLYGLEIDAPKLLEEWKEEYRSAIEDIYKGFVGGSISVAYDKEVLDEMFELSPPGLDELMALKEIIHFMEEQEFDFYVLDSAATGHLIRFLELPGILREWLKAILQLLLKYRGVMRLSRLGEKIVELSRDVRQIRSILINPEKSEFICVTVPEAMVVAQTERLLANIKKLEITCNHLIVNMIIP